jgi:pyruvate ferredoxin oxidoreductase delta subunit
MKKNWKDIPIGGIIMEAGNSRETKTGEWSSKVPSVDMEKCIKCKQCVRNCPERIISLNEKEEVVFDDDYCKGCGLCADICPKKAIKMK